MRALPMPRTTTKVLDEPASANTAAVVSIPAPGEKRRIVIDQIQWSYNAQPTDGKLTVSEDGQPCHSFYITNGGPAVVAKAVEHADNAAVTVTLAAGGTNVKGTLSVDYYIRRAAG